MKKKVCFLLMPLFVFSQAVSFAAPSMQDLKLPKNFYQSKTAGVEIASIRENPKFPGFLTFSVKSPHGDYEINGLSNLQKCLREIDVLEELKAKNDGTGSGIATGAGDSLKETGRGAKNLVVHPVDSAKGIGKGIGKLGGKIGGVFRKKEEGEKGDGLLGSTKREIAKKLGVDVYSRNPYLQEKLEAMAKSQMGGRGLVAIASFIIPVGAVASLAMTASNINSGADKLVDDSDRGDLFKMNKDALIKLGIPEDKSIKLLNHPYYTPRELTYLRFYLEKLKGVQGFESILDAATQADTEIPADKVLYEAQIAANALESDPGITKLEVIPEGVILSKSDKVALVTAYDYVDNAALGNQLAERLGGFRQSLGAKSAEILNGGAVAALFGGAVFLKGIKIRSMCLFEAAGIQPEI